MSNKKEKKVDYVVISVMLIFFLIIINGLLFVITYKNDNYISTIDPIDEVDGLSYYQFKYQEDKDIYKLNDKFQMEIIKINDKLSISINGKNKIIDNYKKNIKVFVKEDSLIYISDNDEIVLYIVDVKNNIKKYNWRLTNIKDMHLSFVDVDSDVITLYFDRYYEYKYLKIDDAKYDLCNEDLSSLDHNIKTEMIYEIKYQDNKYENISLVSDSNLSMTLETRENCIE